VVVLHSRGGEVLELDGMTLMRRNGKIVMSPATWPRYGIFRPSPHLRLYIVACRFQVASSLPLHASYHHCSLSFLLLFTMVSQQLEQAYEKYRYEALFGVWLAVTGATFLRIKRQPYSTRLKVEQYESIFKGTSLGAIVLGIGMSPKRGMRRVA
jgi:hypothetical protein